MYMTYNGEPSLRQRLEELFEEQGTGATVCELAQRFDCDVGSVYRSRRMWLERKRLALLGQCERCGFYEWEHNPVWDGLCLWCRADMAGVALEPLVREWGWEAVIGAFCEVEVRG